MKKGLYFVGLVLLIVLFLIFKPIDTSAGNSIKVTGIVEQISSGGSNDLVFHLKNDSITYYINRGLENGFELPKAKKHFTNQKVKIFYAENWTLLAPFGTKSKHITHLVCNDFVIYSEWK